MRAPIDQVVQVQVREVYGNRLIYPINITAMHFADLTGKKTFSRSDLETMEKLGYRIEAVPVPLKRA